MRVSSTKRVFVQVLKYAGYTRGGGWSGKGGEGDGGEEREREGRGGDYLWIRHCVLVIVMQCVASLVTQSPDRYIADITL